MADLDTPLGDAMAHALQKLADQLLIIHIQVERISLSLLDLPDLRPPNPEMTRAASRPMPSDPELLRLGQLLSDEHAARARVTPTVPSSPSPPPRRHR
ncbi:hypothetical protein OK074_5009 [Actinobacteria bacterium OK074]|nr:hypothetical protein OK074_5009 [Actinobacteria bacterium OK074]